MYTIDDYKSHNFKKIIHVIKIKNVKFSHKLYLFPYVGISRETSLKELNTNFI